MPLPSSYSWLEREGAPKMLVEALKLFGTLEIPGDRDSPQILSWAKELGLERVYSHDSIPWCGLFMAIVAKRAGKTLPQGPLWALNWAHFGSPQAKGNAMLGDVLTFNRDGGGHVSLYVGEDSGAFHCLGGNQRDQVCFSRIAKSRLFSVSRSKWSVAQPPNVRKIHLSASGELSKGEA